MDPMLLWGLSLVGLSVLLLIVELFVPSGGVIALTAGVVGVAGVVCLFLMDSNGALWGSAGILTLLVLFPSAFFAWAKLLPSTSFGRALIGEVSDTEKQRREAAETRERERYEALVGRQGRAVTDLRPVGTVEVDGERFDALADGPAIESGEAIRVTSVRSHQIRVRGI
ncbi:MAG: NfeD family protein [Phycisphaerales bacterium]